MKKRVCQACGKLRWARVHPDGKIQTPICKPCGNKQGIRS